MFGMREEMTTTVGRVNDALVSETRRDHRPRHADRSMTMTAGQRPGTDFRGVFRDDCAGARRVRGGGGHRPRYAARGRRAARTPTTSPTLVRWAAAADVALVPRGVGKQHGRRRDRRRRRSSTSAARCHRCPRRDARRIAVGPGRHPRTGGRAARRVGLRFPVDPSSGAFCSIGGMVSTNAAGARTLRYGSTRPWVRALDCVFADGSRAIVRRGARAAETSPPSRDSSPRSRRRSRAREPRRAAHAGVRKDSSGYALARLRAVAASSSTCSSEARARSRSSSASSSRSRPLPGATASLLASFASLDDAVVGADAARARRRERVRAARPHVPRRRRAGGAPLPVPAGTEAVLLIELEAEDADGRGERGARRSRRALERAGATQRRARSRRARRGTRSGSCVTPRARSSSRLDPSLKSMQFIEDGAVPPDRLADYVRGVRAALGGARYPRRDLRPRRRRARAREPARRRARATAGATRVAGVLADVVDAHRATRRNARRASTAMAGCARRCSTRTTSADALDALRAA